ncbi:hypothetical protein [Microbispora sp. ATCC PTA-5024]|uniref:hypothetical protein n=1 Tax=Microbispora sp. ATCC PTA-5024 TaxID=316330 RepID=UPI0003DD4088|nr:hypothetical protein [Microbispora sp. ATCC PTA-5024]ETK32824.1 hypothetical protein MPTA5024_27750 [Microbispora sp. ATCC PTA-5024]
MKRTLALLTTAAFLTAATIGAPAADAASQPTRSTHITINNYTFCTLVKVSSSLKHGIWSAGLQPPATIPASHTLFVPVSVTFQAESSGFLTGDEGTVVYKATNCEDPGKNGRQVSFYFDNPYIGYNTYLDGDDPPLHWVDFYAQLDQKNAVVEDNLVDFPWPENQPLP